MPRKYGRREVGAHRLSHRPSHRALYREWDFEPMHRPAAAAGTMRLLATIANKVANKVMNKAAGFASQAGSSWPSLQTAWPSGDDLGAARHAPAPASLGLSALLGALDWDHVRDEVDRESRARIVVAGASDSGKSTLLRLLKGMPPAHVLPTTYPPAHVSPATYSPADLTASDGPSERGEDYGLFKAVDFDNGLVAWPGGASPMIGEGDGFGEGEATLHGADLVVWQLDAARGLRDWEYQAICRLRATGRPLLVVLNKCDLQSPCATADEVTRALAQPVIPISARTGQNVISHLLPAMADACPNLTPALGREVPAWRSQAVQRVIMRAAALSGLTGLEPVPLLDLPFQVVLQLRLVLRIAATYGEPVGDRYSRELIATLLGSAGVRYVGQQLAKIVPLVGWVASGALAAGATWAIGRVAATYFEHGRRFPLPPVPDVGKRLTHRWRRGAAAQAAEVAHAAPSAAAVDGGDASDAGLEEPVTPPAGAVPTTPASPATPGAESGPTEGP